MRYHIDAGSSRSSRFRGRSWSLHTVLDTEPWGELWLCAQPEVTVWPITDGPRYRELALQPVPPVCIPRAHIQSLAVKCCSCNLGVSVNTYKVRVVSQRQGSSKGAPRGERQKQQQHQAFAVAVKASWLGIRSERDVPGVVVILPPAARILAASSVRAGL